jgi:hypothetical protein
MLVKELFEDSWSGPNNAWHNQGQDDQWYNGNDEWHGKNSGNMAEDFAVANLVQTDESISDVITARELIGQALQDHEKRHKYFDFLRYLEKKRDSEYSTHVHQQAAKLAKAN